MIVELNTDRLTYFIAKASAYCYLGDMKRSDTTERPGFFEMDYAEGDWSYRDSFTGYYISAGQELVRYKGRPVWTLSYGGGVKEEYYGDQKVFNEIEEFLRSALKMKESDAYQPRGPKQLEKGEWEYRCDWVGDIKSLSGVEKILLNSKEVFEHRFFGGMIVGR